MELKIKKNESWEEFCVRTLHLHKELGYTKKEVFKFLFDKDMANDNIRKISYFTDYVVEAKRQGRDKLFISTEEIAVNPEELNSFYKSDEMIEVEDKELLLKSNQQLRKQVQAYQDKLRVLRAEDRKGFRVSDKVDYMLDKCLEIADAYPSKHINATKKPHSKCWAIAHLSDLHISKVVDLPHNTYNYEVAKSRLKNYFTTFKHECYHRGISDIVIAMTGDNFQLDRLREQSHTNEKVRAEALLDGFDIMVSVIDDLLEQGFNVSLAGINGNESRLLTDEHQGNVDKLIKNNFDFLLFQMLKRKYTNQCNFLNDCDTLEFMFEVNGKLFIIVHGDKLKHSQLDKEIDKVRLKWLQITGKYSDHVLLGHVHQFLSTPTFTRASSLVGADEYAFNGLTIAESDISQPMLIVTEHGDIFSFKVNCK